MRVAPSVRFALVDGLIVILDLSSEDYFALDSEASDAWQRAVLPAKGAAISATATNALRECIARGFLIESSENQAEPPSITQRIPGHSIQKILPNALAAWFTMQSVSRRCAEDGCRVFFRGYLADRSELARTFGHPLPTRGSDDPYLVALAYRRWGSHMIRHVIGEYATAVIDVRQKRVLIAHDAIGCRPVYYGAWRRHLVVSSHVSPVRRGLETLGHRATIDRKYIGDILSLGLHAGTHTEFKGINRVRQGDSVVVSERSTEEIQTWTLRCEDEPQASASEYHEQFRDLLAKAVDSAALSGTTWAELSGGLDSSTVYSVAADQGVAGLEALSIVYSKSSSADERPWMSAVLQQRPRPWHQIDEDLAVPFSVWPNRSLDSPTKLATMWSVFQRYEQLLSEHSVRVVLSGYGGDQVLFGDVVYPVYLADRLLRGRVVSSLRTIDEFRRSEEGCRSFREYIWKYAAGPAWRHFRNQSVREVREPDQIAYWLSADLVRSEDLELTRLPGATPRQRRIADQYCFEALWRISLGAGQFWNQDLRAAEIRYPLLYRPLVEFMYSLPWNLRIIPGRNRVLQRDALRGMLPHSILARTDKRGPDEAFMRGFRESGVFYDMLTNNPRLVDAALVDRDKWRLAVDRARYGVLTNFASFLSTVATEVWLRQM